MTTRRPVEYVSFTPHAHREPSRAYRWAEAIVGFACIFVIGWLVVYGLPG